MALIFCPECRHQVSDVAESCPKCGHPIKGKNIVVINNSASSAASSSSSSGGKFGCLSFIGLVVVIIIAISIG
ncbi:zinc-ribbon domain-containing protein [Bacillus sp. FJAT-27264]|uniref:zinc-ribbon domain-containing protein n=1 Tax=Paenibacillus sp. (strain DSM 101736 / FJAT-27264) TaxID=1850362 RepID=UPI0009F2DE93